MQRHGLLKSSQLLVQQEYSLVLGDVMLPDSVFPVQSEGMFSQIQSTEYGITNYTEGEFTFTRGHKQYELSNHLGNVLVTIQDRKWGRQTTTQTPPQTNCDYYLSYVVTISDYHAFGSTIIERSASFGGGYRFGFNTQEKEVELGDGVTTAEFWMYDGKLGRRWNVDPVVKEYESPYASFANNPIWFVDQNGTDTALYDMSTGNEIKNARKKAKGKTPIFYVESINKGESTKEMWKRAVPLQYKIGANTKFQGITGNSFRTNHPLYKIGTKFGSVVYQEDLLDMTNEFNMVLSRAENYFYKRRVTGPNGLIFLYARAYLNFDDGADYDLKSPNRDNIDIIPSFAAVNIGEWSIYNNKLTRYDDYGNISFGYWSRIMGLPEAAGYSGAAKNQEGKFKSKGDDPRDTRMVQIGYNMFYQNYLPKLSTQSNWKWMKGHFSESERNKAKLK